MLFSMGILDAFKTVLDPFKVMFGDPDKKRILAEGKSAAAKILALNETGPGYVTVNEQPLVTLELEIYPEGEKSYTTSLRTLISRLATSQFQPGNMINVKVDPLDKLKVVLDTTGTAASKVAVGNVENKISDDAKSGTAEVLEMKKTDKTKGGNTVYEVKFEITGSDIEKYSFSKEVPLPDFALGHFNVGKKYPCKVDSIDKTKVQLDITF